MKGSRREVGGKWERGKEGRGIDEGVEREGMGRGRDGGMEQIGRGSDRELRRREEVREEGRERGMELGFRDDRNFSQRKIVAEYRNSILT